MTIISTQQRPILVTGCIRSGTSWTGHILSACDKVCYLQEPFNPFVRNRSIFPLKLPWFWYAIESSLEDEVREAMTKTLAFRFSLTSTIGGVRDIEGLRNVYRAWISHRRARLGGFRALVKDPVAFFSSEWLAREFGFQVVIMVRHPAAFVDSMVRKQWFHPMEHFLQQGALMNGPLKPFRREIESAATQGRTDPVGQASLIWKLVYATASDLLATHEDWTLLRNEGLSSQPQKHFGKLFQQLALKPNSRTAAMISE